MTIPPPRRFLPSLALLSAFEAAARSASITVAAKELSLTQGAVSRQIRALEEQLEVKLFVRERQSIRLTLAGEAYAREIRDALRRITTASLSLRANPQGGTLNLATVPTLGARWLTPRLSRFVALNPRITINLATRPSEVDFRTESLDASIQYGRPSWPGNQMVLLRREQVVPTCCPDLKRYYAFDKAEDIRKAPLLHLTWRPDAWEKWLSFHGVPAEAVHGMLFDQFATISEAAAAGLGVGLLPSFLIEEELATGRLVRALDLPMASQEGYYLVWPADRSTYPPLMVFRDWLVAESASGQ
jgi:LysR family glycine cleavage system transcriptional activator